MKLNRIVIIGNGFDKAHHLPTGYDDFMVSYIKERLKYFAARNKPNKYFEPEHDFLLFNFTKPISESFITTLKECENNLDLSELCGQWAIGISGVKGFSKGLYNIFTIRDWVDVEREYFFFLKSLKHSNRQIYLQSVKSVNDELEIIKDRLVEYLDSIDVEFDEYGDFKKKYVEIMQDVSDFKKIKTFQNTDIKINKTLILNFNYTSTAMSYADLIDNSTCINIHGDLMSKNIVFGYGDDSTEQYKAFEEMDEIEVLRNFKSSWYTKNYNYRNLFDFVKSAEFDVKILGHSCGLSDKTLLKSIFENKNCLQIIPYCYNEMEYFKKSINLSRHFENKQPFREIVLPYEEEKIMPQFKMQY